MPIRLFVRTLVLFVCLAPIAALAQDTGGSATREAPLRPVRLVTVEAPRTDITRTFYGQVVARQTVDLAFQVGGQLTSFPVLNGEEVARGALLARLDIVPFERAVRRAEVNLEQAQRDYDRIRKLAETSAASEVRAEDARTARDLARIELDEARDALDDATLTAAFDGIVARRLVANYSTVSQGTPILRLHDMSEPRVQIDVPERLFRRAGSLADITFTADLGAGIDGVPLTVAEYAAETTGVSQSYTVDLALPEVEGYTPLPGRTATVTVALARPGGDTLDVPATALLATEDRGARVMVFEPSGADDNTGTARPLPVTVISREGATVAVATGEALEPGMQIVSTGAHMLREGERVRRFTGYSEES